MATTGFSLFSFSLCVLLLCHGSTAQLFGPSFTPWQSHRQGGFRECRFDRLQTFEPARQVRSQAGLTEYFDEANEQFQCTGVFVIRRVIEPRGLLLPRYANTHGLVYIIQGSGVAGLAFPGCPETYQQQFQQFEQPQFTQAGSQKFRDEHQKLHRYRQGDVIALPAGVAHWFYNDGDAPVVAVYVFDVNSNANQLEPRQKEFLLAGNSKRVQHSGQNIFGGFNAQLLSEAFGVSEQAARGLQSRNDQRGEIIRVDHGLQFPRPAATQQQEGQRRYYQQEQAGGSGSINGLDENFCPSKVRLNIEDPNRADTYNPRAGRITRLNSQKFPILSLVQMSATRVNLYQNAILSPSWNINAHSVLYMIQGHARVQVVNNHGRAVFSGVLRRGQLLIIPQHYAVVKKAEREGCQYVEFKTNANSMVSHIAGENSILRAMPADVLANAYRIPREEARNLKNSRRGELGAFAPKFSHKIYQVYRNEDESSASTGETSE